jgi:hypothetical protein
MAHWIYIFGPFGLATCRYAPAAFLMLIGVYRSKIRRGL